MTLDQIIEHKISEAIEATIESKIEQISERVSKHLTRPHYHEWGRYLSPMQARIYVGVKSTNGLKEFCRNKGIKSIRINNRVIRYDRNDLDKINVRNVIKDYLSTQ